MIKKNRRSESGSFNPRIVLALVLCSAGIGLGALSVLMSTSLGERVAQAAAPARIGTFPRSTNTSGLPFAIAQPIKATFDWIVSFQNPGAANRILAVRAPGGVRPRNSRSRTLAPFVSDAVAASTSPPLRDLPNGNPYSAWVEQPEPRTPANRLPQLPRNPLSVDPVLQTTAAAAGMPSVGASFEGMEVGQACGNCLPPDPNGAVGPNHYVQMVNSSVAVYSKTGTTLMAPKAINTLWSLTPNSECFQHNNGDPIVLYDQLADRWLVSQFVTTSTAPTVPNYAQCIAISQTADPTGAYYLYEFDEAPDVFNDYPHIGLWPDGYYMSTNQFPNSTTGSTAAGAWAFERQKMLLGQTARYVFFDETPLVTNTYTPFGQLPASLDGTLPPPNGAPNYFAEIDDVDVPNAPPATGLHDEMHIWKFHVDWANPANSTFGAGSTPPGAGAFGGQYKGNAGQPDFIVPIADYLASACQIENGPNDCSPEKVNPPQPPDYLDVLGDRLMFRLTYRNFGDHESLVVNHTADVVDAGTGTGRNGVRWYELRNVSNTPVVFQQGTFAPLDTNNPLWRWMGSAAMDHSGNIALGYSASGPNQFPSLYYAGRLASDPLGQLAQGEAALFPGLGNEIQIGVFPFRNRWGDYSALTVDPTDDCTFWYTNEYLAANNNILGAPWRTRIGSFRFPQCVSPSSVQILSVVSRKVHGGAGTFDVDLPLTGTGIECRSGGANGDHQLVATFAAPVTFTSVATTCGSVASTSTSGSNVTINLTGVPNASRCSITVNGVNGGGNASLPANFLAGDTNADGFVNSADISQTKSQSGASVSSSNFREDLNVDGFLNSADISLAKSKSGTALP